MVITPTINPGSSLDRAICAYLISVGVGVGVLEEAGDTIVVPADGLEIKSYPNITVISGHSMHDPVPTGIEVYEVSIICRFSVAGASQSSNPYAVRVARDAVVGLVMAAMMQSDDNATLDFTARAITAAGRALATSGSPQDQANNADMVNFTASHVHFLGSERGVPNEEGTAWSEKRNFRISVCSVAIE